MFDDQVTNLSDVPQEMELLYHTNFGTPLLGAGARVRGAGQTGGADESGIRRGRLGGLEPL